MVGNLADPIDTNVSSLMLSPRRCQFRSLEIVQSIHSEAAHVTAFHPVEPGPYIYLTKS